MEAGDEGADDDGEHECVDGYFLAFELAHGLELFFEGVAHIVVEDGCFFMDEVPYFEDVDGYFVVFVDVFQCAHDDFVDCFMVAEGVRVCFRMCIDFCRVVEADDFFDEIFCFWIEEFFHDFGVIQSEEDGFGAAEEFANVACFFFAVHDKVIFFEPGAAFFTEAEDDGNDAFAFCCVLCDGASNSYRLVISMSSADKNRFWFHKLIKSRYLIKLVKMNASAGIRTRVIS